jgi:hypothetical protein
VDNKHHHQRTLRLSFGLRLGSHGLPAITVNKSKDLWHIDSQVNSNVQTKLFEKEFHASGNVLKISLQFPGT